MPHVAPVHWKKLARVFEKSGWKYTRTKGDHLVYKKGGFVRPVVIPMYEQVPAFITQNNLRTAKISKEEYLKLLSFKK